MRTSELNRRRPSEQSTHDENTQPRSSVSRFRASLRAAGASATSPRNQKPKSKRESVESFVVVFVTFLIWSLEAEGFVIPTGSMAPTLMGRHKEVVCPQCGYTYTVNAGGEVEPSGQGG